MSCVHAVGAEVPQPADLSDAEQDNLQACRGLTQYHAAVNEVLLE
jgi:hypothetical protein